MSAPDELIIDGVRYVPEKTLYHEQYKYYITFYKEVDDMVIEIPSENVRIYFDGRKPDREKIWK